MTRTDQAALWRRFHVPHRVVTMPSGGSLASRDVLAAGRRRQEVVS